MSLEKLLIFGLALVVVTVFATWSDTTGTARKAEKTDYKTKIDDLVAKSK